MNALIIGRFQPVHNGHVELLRKVDSMGLEKILLGIGIEGKGRTPRNPFSYDEISQIWLSEIEKLKTKVELYAIPDINDNTRYASHVERITGCSEEDTVVVSGNGYTVDCFTNHGKNYRTHSVGKSVPLGNGYLCATQIREWMLYDGPWRQYVPKSTKDVMEKIDGEQIIKELGAAK